MLALDETPGVHETAAMLTPYFDRVTRGEAAALTRRGDTVTVRRVWVLSPNHLWADVVVAPNATPGAYTATVLTGFQLAPQPCTAHISDHQVDQKGAPKLVQVYQYRVLPDVEQ